MMLVKESDTLHPIKLNDSIGRREGERWKWVDDSTSDKEQWVHRQREPICCDVQVVAASDKVLWRISVQSKVCIEMNRHMLHPIKSNNSISRREWIYWLG